MKRFNPFRRRRDDPDHWVDSALEPMRCFVQFLLMAGADRDLIVKWVEREISEFQMPELGPAERLFAERARDSLRRNGLLRDPEPENDAA